MTDEQKMVRDWHRKFGSFVSDKPTIPSNKTQMLREDLIQEELDELSDAAMKRDLVAVADALGDLLYVILGAAVSYGIDLEPIFKEIHRSNMSKVWADGTVRHREDGKVLKPLTYSPANLAPIIEQQKGI